jgi:hypothetical protein
VIVLKGKQCQLSKEEVETRMKGVEPVKGRNLFVDIDGQKYPVKQVLYLSLREQCGCLDMLDFSDSYAQNILSQIGFEVIDFS